MKRADNNAVIYCSRWTGVVCLAFLLVQTSHKHRDVSVHWVAGLIKLSAVLHELYGRVAAPPPPGESAFYDAHYVPGSREANTRAYHQCTTGRSWQ